jgi:hypothetical protein
MHFCRAPARCQRSIHFEVVGAIAHRLTSSNVLTPTPHRTNPAKPPSIASASAGTLKRSRGSEKTVLDIAVARNIVIGTDRPSEHSRCRPVRACRRAPGAGSPPSRVARYATARSAQAERAERAGEAAWRSGYSMHRVVRNSGGRKYLRHLENEPNREMAMNSSAYRPIR